MYDLEFSMSIKLKYIAKISLLVGIKVQKI